MGPYKSLSIFKLLYLSHQPQQSYYTENHKVCQDMLANLNNYFIAG
jgi:hypothetical protein